MWRFYVYIRGLLSTVINRYVKAKPIKTSEKILVAVAAVVGLGWMLKAKAAGNLTFFPGNVTNAYFEGSTPVLEVSILVQNTSGTSLTLQSFAANVMARQIDSTIVVGNASGFSPISIPANSEGAIVVRLRLLPIGIVTDIIRAFQMKNYKQTITLVGGANIAGFPPVRVPINLPFSIGAV